MPASLPLSQPLQAVRSVTSPGTRPSFCLTGNLLDWVQANVVALERELEAERQAVHSPETKAVLCKMAELEVELFPSSAPQCRARSPAACGAWRQPPP